MQRLFKMLKVSSFYGVLVLNLGASQFTFASDSNHRNTGQEIFSNLENSVYQVLSAPSPDSPKSSYGTGFIIDEGRQILATNFHVISDLVKERKQNLFIVDRKNQRRIPAQVIAVDILSDLALVKVDEKLNGRPLKLRDDLPKSGDRSYSLGLPEDLTMSIIEGVYNGEKGFEFYSKIVLSTPLNSGMSGGPTVDSQGRVIGVNVATARGSNSLSFSVPQRFLRKLIEQAQGPKEEKSREISSIPNNIDDIKNISELKKPFSEESVLPQWKPELTAQLQLAQKELYTQLFDRTPAASSKNIETPSWAIDFTRHKDLDCWSDQSRSEEKSIQNFRESCAISDSSAFPISSGVGTMRVAMMENSKTKDEKFKYSEMGSGIQLDRHLPHALHFTGEFCNHEFVRNQNNLVLSVNYCFAPFREFNGLYNYDLQVRTYDEDRKNYLEVQTELRGFSPENIKKISEKFLSSIKRKRL